MELRAVISELVQTLDFCFAQGEEGKRLVDESMDVFTMELAPMYMSFTRRELKE